MLRGLREERQYPRQVIFGPPFHSLSKRPPRFGGNPQLARRNGVTIPLDWPQVRGIQVKYQLRGSAVDLCARLCRLVTWFVDDDLVRAAGEALHFKVAFEVRQDAAEYPGSVRFQFHGYLARGPNVPFQE